ncbi:MAG: agmatinase, partial [Candidatus Methanoperedens sp.]|nr:agmatinase [Candidatus Methanoperedens sp.]
MHRTLFADAISDYDDAKYVICGVPFDGTSCFRRGSRFAPHEMRDHSYNFEKYSSFFDIDMDDIKIHDDGDLEVAQDVETTLDLISVHAEKYITDGKIPVMMGGEHSLTLPFVRACKKKYPDIGFVVLDAHMDMREEYEGELNSHACISRNIFEKITSKYASIGIRSGMREEYDYVKANKIMMFSAEDVFSMGIENIIAGIRKN